MFAFLSNLYQFRVAFLPRFAQACQSRNLDEMVLFLTTVRREVLNDIRLLPVVNEYLRMSDTCASSYSLSDDRTHGEHHKFDVLLLGTLLVTTCGFAHNHALNLLYIALNEHDEGRRVTGDQEHEQKGALMVVIRMASLFPATDAAIVADAIAAHGGITVTKQSHRYDSNVSLYLCAADKLAAMDPTRHTSYALKKLGNTVELPEFESTVVNTWKRALGLARQSASALGLDVAEDLSAAAESMEVVMQSIRGAVHAGRAVASAIRDGVDVLALCDWASARYGISLPPIVLPVYNSMF